MAFLHFVFYLILYFSAVVANKRVHLNPGWFYLSDAGLPRLNWKRGSSSSSSYLLVIFTWLVSTFMFWTLCYVPSIYIC